MRLEDLDHDRLVVATYGSSEGAINFIGEVTGFLNEPSVCFKAEPGECPCTWAASLCRLATPEEEIVYWKARAAKGDEFRLFVSQGGVP